MNMRNKCFYFLVLFVLQMPLLCKAQYGQIDIKPNEIMAQQKDIANQVAAKISIEPLKFPDAKSLVSINQSGDGVISLPLVNVRGRKLTLPISLSYVTSGIKVDQQASEVGLGWNISIGSITRDYGAYEPDYTYTGSEFNVLSHDGTSGYDGKLVSNSFYLTSSLESYAPSADHIYSPINQNKFLEYNNATGKAPDTYELNVPGLESNDFWNAETTVPIYGSSPKPPSFTFSKSVPWKIGYTKQINTFGQEISRINEFNYQLDVNGNFENYLLNDASYNMAAAIGFYPYVISQGSVGVSISCGHSASTASFLIGAIFPVC
jgi:hypothetical protein